ncbi:hypothetical protein ERUR111494_03215 [Erysipelothrix urinaevulpis]|uniref:hypothetical protein n=1 Tax=Erysipelothrix urinaevulpis TaxID=2683717 RepID=UPI001357CA60|nr:hypothetical protein [Erysipelothrix urinaevulpis]
MKIKKYIIILLFFISACSMEGRKQSSHSDGQWFSEYNLDSSSIKNISFDELIKMEDKESFAIVLSTPDCGACQKAIPSLNTLAFKYELNNIYHINASNIDQKQRAALNALLNNQLKTHDDGSISLLVPSLYTFTNGQIKDSQVGLTDSLKSLEQEYLRILSDM